MFELIPNEWNQDMKAFWIFVDVSGEKKSIQKKTPETSKITNKILHNKNQARFKKEERKTLMFKLVRMTLNS